MGKNIFIQEQWEQKKLYEKNKNKKTKSLYTLWLIKKKKSEGRFPQKRLKEPAMQEREAEAIKMEGGSRRKGERKRKPCMQWWLECKKNVEVVSERKGGEFGWTLYYEVRACPFTCIDSDICGFQGIYVCCCFCMFYQYLCSILGWIQRFLSFLFVNYGYILTCTFLSINQLWSKHLILITNIINLDI